MEGDGGRKGGRERGGGGGQRERGGRGGEQRGARERERERGDSRTATELHEVAFEQRMRIEADVCAMDESQPLVACRPPPTHTERDTPPRACHKTSLCTRVREEGIVLYRSTSAQLHVCALAMHLGARVLCTTTLYIVYTLGTHTTTLLRSNRIPDPK